MPLGVTDVNFESVDFPLAAGDLAVGTVRFTFDEDYGPDEGVTHHVAVKVRVKAPRSATIEELHQILLEKAVEQLRHAISRAEGKTAKQLSLEVEEKMRLDQEELNRPIELG